MNDHVHPTLAATLHRYWPAPPPSTDCLHAACDQLGAAWQAHEARIVADQERKAAERRALETASMPPLPWHLAAKRRAIEALSVLRMPLTDWWERKNHSEQALRIALRAHIAHRQGATQ